MKRAGVGTDPVFQWKVRWVEDGEAYEESFTTYADAEDLLSCLIADGWAPEMLKVAP